MAGIVGCAPLAIDNNRLLDSIKIYKIVFSTYYIKYDRSLLYKFFLADIRVS